jgi:hypothetical protein
MGGDSERVERIIVCDKRQKEPVLWPRECQARPSIKEFWDRWGELKAMTLAIVMAEVVHGPARIAVSDREAVAVGNGMEGEFPMPDGVVWVGRIRKTFREPTSSRGFGGKDFLHGEINSPPKYPAGLGRHALFEGIRQLPVSLQGWLRE